MDLEPLTEDNYLHKVTLNDCDVFMFMRKAIFEWPSMADKVFKAYRQVHGNHKYLCFLSEVRINELAQIEPLDATPERIEEFKNYSKYKRPEIMYEVEILLSSTIERLITLLVKMHTFNTPKHVFLIHDEGMIYGYTFDFGLDSVVVDGKQIKCHQITNNMRLPAIHLRYNRIDVILKTR